MKRYIVYLGEEVKLSTQQLEQALQVYESLPDGTGKSWRHRRSLIEENVIKEDKK